MQKLTDAKLCKALTPNEPGKDRPAMKDIQATLNEFKAMPEKDQNDLRKAFGMEIG